MKKILVPTDFSPTAENALKVAAQLAKRFNGEIFLLHMLELPLELLQPSSGSAVASGSQSLPEALFFMKLAKKRFREIIEKPYLRDIKVHETVEFHQAFDGIMEVSQQHDCDLIVMGSHGASGFKEMFIGSNTEKVVRNSTIPVLVIKREIPVFEVDSFAYATDCHLDSRHNLKLAQDFAEKIGAHLHIVYINTANNFMTSADAQKCLDEYIEGADLQNYTTNIFNDVSVEKGILNFAESVDAGLIGISTHGRKGLAHFFNGSISEDLVNHSSRPVITFKL